jgi:hypothetical protein
MSATDSTEITREEIEEAIGYEGWRRLVIALLKQHRHPIDVARIVSSSVISVKSIARRNGLEGLYATPKFVFIYTLICPLTQTVKYVGKTVDLSRRLHQHVSYPAKGPMKKWIEQLHSHRLKPKIRAIAKVKFEYGDRAEKALIEKHLKHGPLLNIRV